MSIKERVETILFGPPGLARMCVHPEEAAVPSYEDVPGHVARYCDICGSQCA
jgi:hypothetical protein